MSDDPFNVLFLCTGNTARSVLAEGILRKDGTGRFNAFSAGSQPKGKINPFALTVLGAYGYPTDGYRSKGWEEFAAPGFRLYGLRQRCRRNLSVWPGQPTTAHWGIEDPAPVDGSDIEKERAFVTAFKYLKNRISVFTSLPIRTLDKMALGAKLREIGRLDGATPRATS
jgi:protein-tyrosine-phosphatase